LICLSLVVAWPEEVQLATSPALEDIELSMRLPHGDFKLYETIEMSRFNAKEPLPFMEFDVQTAAPLRHRLDDKGKIFSLLNAYEVILEDGGFLSIDKTRAPKTNRSSKGTGDTAAAVAAPEPEEPVSDTKGNLLSLYFGPNGPSFDVLIRALHPIFFTKNEWLTMNDYSLSICTYLSSPNIKICMAFELWIYFRLHIKKNYFLGHNTILNIVNSGRTSIRGSFKDLNLYQIYTTMTIYAIKVRRYYQTF
jgi:hypothetical protein